MRVTSGDHWADVSEEPFGWRPKNRIRDAVDGGFYDGFIVALVTDRVTAWSEPGDPKQPEAWETVDAVFGDKVLAAALDIWKRTPDPNDSSDESKP